MYNTVIFDADGTLIDSSLGIISAVEKVIKLYKFKPLNQNELKEFIATSPIQKAFMTFCNTNEELAQDCSVKYRQYYLNDDLYKTTIYDGIIDLLTFLQKQNYKMGIASYKRQDTLDKILKHLNLCEYFDCILGADNENKLTKKDIIQKCILQLNSNPENTIYIGDSFSDGIASKELNCKFIAVKYGFGFKNEKEILQCNPIFTAEKVTDILENFIANI